MAGTWSSAQDLFGLLTSQQEFKGIGFWEFLRHYRKEEAELQSLRDATLSTRGSDTPGYVPPEVDCPGRHWVKLFVAWDDGFDCSACGDRIEKGAKCLGCRLCDYDVCPECLQRLVQGGVEDGVVGDAPPIGDHAPRAGMQKKLHRRVLGSSGHVASGEVGKSEAPVGPSPNLKSKTRSTKARVKNASPGGMPDGGMPDGVLPHVHEIGAAVDVLDMVSQDPCVQAESSRQSDLDVREERGREAWEIPVGDSDDSDL